MVEATRSVEIPARSAAQPIASRLQAAHARFYDAYAKRALDLVLAFLLLPLLLPIIAALALAVRRDGGPAFYGHVRVGRSGKKFRCWKIRTMVVNADERLRQLLESDPEIAAIWQREYKLDKDPRITSLGGFLRKSSLDELPQLWNVITGEMSFVGPRPVIDAEVEKYGKHRSSYLACMPGITGLWQVSGRNDLSYDERVQLDVDYSKRKSFLMDTKILLMTVKSVIGGTGK